MWSRQMSWQHAGSTMHSTLCEQSQLEGNMGDVAYLSRLQGALIWPAPLPQGGVHLQEPPQSDHIWVKGGLYRWGIQEPPLQMRRATAQLAVTPSCW